MLVGLLRSASNKTTMRKSIWILFLFCIAFDAHAQHACGAISGSQTGPVIDSLTMNEVDTEISIYGTFGNIAGAVWVDSVALTIKTWNDRIIVATIPEIG